MKLLKNLLILLDAVSPLSTDSVVTNVSKVVGNSNNYVIISLILTAIPLCVAVVVFYIQKRAQDADFFKNYAKALYSTNPTEQITAAILLRDYVIKRRFSAQTKNIMVALLRTPISVSLQKVVADVFSYAPKMDGQDMQHINMLGALIKPQSRIQYELTHEKKYKEDRLSMKQADFYQAIIRECNISNVDGTKAVFYCSNLSYTTFRNCILTNADFRGANVDNVKFDEDCILEGANFDGAVGLSTARIKVRKESDVMSYPLSDYLDKKGIFREQKPTGKYLIPNERTTVFISKLGVMDPVQKLHYERVINILQGSKDISLIQIDREQYPIVSQLSDVSNHLKQCEGCVIFAFEYIEVSSGYVHKDVVGNDKKRLENVSLVSPWLHVEAALANEEKMPCLIIYDKNLYSDGMFDIKVIEPDRNLYSVEYSDELSINTREVEEWRNSVREYRMNKAR